MPFPTNKPQEFAIRGTLLWKLGKGNKGEGFPDATVQAKRHAKWQIVQRGPGPCQTEALRRLVKQKV